MIRSSYLTQGPKKEIDDNLSMKKNTRRFAQCQLRWRAKKAQSLIGHKAVNSYPPPSTIFLKKSPKATADEIAQTTDAF